MDTVVNIALCIENFKHLRDAFHMFHLIILIHGQFNGRKFDRPFVFSYDHRMKFVVADFIKKPCNVVCKMVDFIIGTGQKRLICIHPGPVCQFRCNQRTDTGK